jgi:hypothetical protein
LAFSHLFKSYYIVFLKLFFIGTEYTNAQINEALNAENPYDIVPQQDTSGHGTFLASIAAGRETDGFEGAAPDAELIVVKLRKARQFYLTYILSPQNRKTRLNQAQLWLGLNISLQKRVNSDALLLYVSDLVQI